jgi:hypothetical protein
MFMSGLFEWATVYKSLSKDMTISGTSQSTTSIEANKCGAKLRSVCTLRDGSSELDYSQSTAWSVRTSMVEDLEGLGGVLVSVVVVVELYHYE